MTAVHLEEAPDIAPGTGGQIAPPVARPKGARGGFLATGVGLVLVLLSLFVVSPATASGEPRDNSCCIRP